MTKINNKSKIWIVAIFVTSVLIGSLITTQDNLAFAGGKHKKSNEASQNITQLQGLDQSASVDSENNTLAAGNNVGLTFNANEGNNALGQQ